MPAIRDALQECLLPPPASTNDYIEVEESFSGSHASSPPPVINDCTASIEHTIPAHTSTNDCSIPSTPTATYAESTGIYCMFLSQTMKNVYDGDWVNSEEEIVFYSQQDDKDDDISCFSTGSPYDTVVWSQLSTSLWALHDCNDPNIPLIRTL